MKGSLTFFERSNFISLNYALEGILVNFYKISYLFDTRENHSKFEKYWSV